MLEPWLGIDGVRDRIEEFGDASGLDLVRLGTTADDDEIAHTAHIAPLVVSLTVMAYDLLRQRTEVPDTIPVAGNSIGELAAAAIAGIVTPADAVHLAAIRGAELATVCASEATGLSVVFGGDPDEVRARLAELDLDQANRSSPGHIVAGGPVSALAELAERPPADSRVVRLDVAGAFHTRYMEPAREKFAVQARQFRVSDPIRPIVSNADATVVTTGDGFMERLITQVSGPVRWEACLGTLGRLGARAAIELPPAGALAGLLKRDMQGTPVLAVKTPAELEKVPGFLVEHG
ncbi:ACP S-malonyltransferase [Actinophytocola oryzae]|uniref:[acyl-carrier-protein] S-malonyltransferase n=1 Tax=Actinophytocola oryzae TaxID=502181 RepID=A0A4R7UTS7_9PSEU|nr:ACP S-malonyltransferase [Actinophytocola oryzae]TDV37791.1 [acyl-carrier-protein] S-malonyltransferase [Actinophytocola oryzae]